MDTADGAPPEAVPAAATGARPAALHGHRDLFGARSVVGAIAVVGVLCFFAFGEAAIDEWVKKASGFDVGSAYNVSETVSFTPASGWEVDPDGTVAGFVVTATKNGVEFKILSLSVPPGETFKSVAKDTRAIDKQDGTYVTVTAIKPFVSTSGANGVTWKAHGPKDASETWLVAEGANFAQMSAAGSASNWDSVAPDLEAMAKSITVSAPGGSASP